MAKAFKVGKSRELEFRSGLVSGRIVRVHTKNVNYKGYVRYASGDDPEIKSDKTDHIALHRRKTLRHLRR